MVIKQGEIYKVNLSPTSGHEQSGYRLVVVVSNDFFNKKTQLAIVCPITNTKNGFPLHIELDSQTKTTGAVLCENIRTLDMNAGQCTLVENMPQNIMTQILDVISSEF